MGTEPARVTINVYLGVHCPASLTSLRRRQRPAPASLLLRVLASARCWRQRGWSTCPGEGEWRRGRAQAGPNRSPGLDTHPQVLDAEPAAYGGGRRSGSRRAVDQLCRLCRRICSCAARIGGGRGNGCQCSGVSVGVAAQDVDLPLLTEQARLVLHARRAAGPWVVPGAPPEGGRGAAYLGVRRSERRRRRLCCLPCKQVDEGVRCSAGLSARAGAILL